MGWHLLARGHGGLRGTFWALVPLFGVLLTVHHIADAKVTPHLEVEAAICAGVALCMAEAVVGDAHGQCAVGELKHTGLSDDRVK